MSGGEQQGPAERRVALLSIHPRYAEAILSGLKSVEFRRRRLAADVRFVVMYATSPTRAVLGGFSVAGQVSASPDEVWRRCGARGGISEDAFLAYYDSCDVATAILVGDVVRLRRPVPLQAVPGRPSAPQSWRYMRVPRGT